MNEFLKIFENPDQLIYTPFYCEENIYKLCEFIRINFPDLLGHCHVVFISNNDEKVLLGSQKLGDPDHRHCVIWDYHVILIYKNTDYESHESIAFDFDTILPFPCKFNEYYADVFIVHSNSQYCPKFRVISAEDYLNTFSSDRSRMKDSDGRFIKPPPQYPCIQMNENENNLNHFISMKPNEFVVGQIMNLDEFRTYFTK